MTSSRPIALFVLLAAPTFTGAACENWPLFAHLPDEDPGPGEPSSLAVSEDEFLPDLTIQGIGTLTAPSIVTITGSSEDCGFDPEADWPSWPEHPLDVDGDGTTDTFQPRFSGWYSGDTDVFSITAGEPITVGISQTWDNAPAGDANAPYQPTEEAGDWADESDLDWVLFSVATAAPDEITSDGGFSRAYPQADERVYVVEPGTPQAVAVGCHHEQPTGYTLVLDVRGR